MKLLKTDPSTSTEVFSRSIRSLKSILVTGGAGFIGSAFIRFCLTHPHFQGKIINLDLLTYAGNPDNLNEIRISENNDRYFFHKGDILDTSLLHRIFEEYAVDTVVHFAAESHVDRSIISPENFIKTNVNGTFNLLETARACWKDTGGKLFHHISTDEVFGSLGETGSFNETTPYAPRSPYSASKAASDHLVKAYGHTYNLPVTLSNCSNNYGPYQFPEKLIPLLILNMKEKKKLPIYGDGKNVRDWLHVNDHVRAIGKIISTAPDGSVWLVGGDSQADNLSIVHLLCKIFAIETGVEPEELTSLIHFVKDRPGHDFRYAIDACRIKRELGWKPLYNLEEGLAMTVRWYLSNVQWIKKIQSGEYMNWIKDNYAGR